MNNKYGTFKKVEAIYTETFVAGGENNPFIMALPDPIPIKDIQFGFSYTPEISELIKKQEVEKKLINLSIIKELNVVFEPYIQIKNAIDDLIYNGYKNRNPIDKTFNIEMREICQAKEELKKNGETKLPRDFQHSEILTVFGISGMGKTTSVETILSHFPQVIFHRKFDGKPFTRTQIVWLKIECPYNATIGSLCKNFFHAIDDLLGTQHEAQSAFNTKSTDRMILDMMHLATLYGIGLLIIDEIQNVNNQKTSEDSVLDFLTQIINSVPIPIVCIGTPAAQKLLFQNFRIARRLTSKGCITWSNMQNRSRDWNNLINGLWKLQLFEEPVPLSDKFNDALYEESQGITSVVTTLFRLSQSDALMMGGRKAFIPSFIIKTSKNRLGDVRDMVQAINPKNKGKKGVKQKIDMLGDLTLRLTEINEAADKDVRIYQMSKLKLKEQLSELEIKELSITKNIITELEDLGIIDNIKINGNELQQLVYSIVEKNINMDYIDIRKGVIKIILEMQANQVRANKVSKDTIQIQGDSTDLSGYIIKNGEL